MVAAAASENLELLAEYIISAAFDGLVIRASLTIQTVARALLLARWDGDRNISVKGDLMVIKATGLTSEEVVFPPRKV
ncbi:MAG: hypothetical protein ACKOCX_06005 [Planctomycetota bacterium]